MVRNGRARRMVGRSSGVMCGMGRGRLMRSNAITGWAAEGSTRLTRARDRTYEGDQVFSVSNGRALIAGTRHKQLYSQDLSQKWELTMRVLSKQFPRTDIIGEGGAKGQLRNKMDNQSLAIIQ